MSQIPGETEKVSREKIKRIQRQWKQIPFAPQKVWYERKVRGKEGVKKFITGEIWAGM